MKLLQRAWGSTVSCWCYVASGGWRVPGLKLLCYRPGFPFTARSYGTFSSLPDQCVFLSTQNSFKAPLKSTCLWCLHSSTDKGPASDGSPGWYLQKNQVSCLDEFIKLTYAPPRHQTLDILPYGWIGTRGSFVPVFFYL